MYSCAKQTQLITLPSYPVVMLFRYVSQEKHSITYLPDIQTNNSYPTVFSQMFEDIIT